MMSHTEQSLSMTTNKRVLSYEKSWQRVMEFENLPNEILLDCLKYFHALDLFYSFSQLNQRFDQLIRTLPWYVDFQDVQRSLYDRFCQHMLDDLDGQEQIDSLRLSNENTPGQIEDFLSRFSLEQFSRLRSLTLIDLGNNNIQSLKDILPKLSQLTTLRLLNSGIDEYELQPCIPINHLQTLAMNSNLAFVARTIPMKRLTLSTVSLNEISRLFQYTPLLQYLNVACIRMEVMNAEYHRSSCPAHLKHLILADFQPDFHELNCFLQNMANLRNLTVTSSNDSSMISAPHWQQLITSSFPYLKDFRFKLGYDSWSRISVVSLVFPSFQTDFWLKEHHWYVECLVQNSFCMIYTVPYRTAFSQLPLQSRRISARLSDDAQIFEHVRKLVVSENDVRKHGKYYFSNVTSLVITDSLRITNEDDERHFIDCLSSLLKLTHLKHLELSLDCRSERLFLLLQILQLAPQLSSLCTKRCSFELLAAHYPKSSRCLNDQIRKLNLREYCPFGNHQLCRVNLLDQSVPNLEQLTMSMVDSDDLFFLLNHFSKLSSFTVHFMSKDYPQELEMFKKQALERNAIVDEVIVKFRDEFLATIGVWITRNTG